ncbi:MAG: ribonuclease HI family protein [Candidatus Altimarinota bacterium]
MKKVGPKKSNVKGQWSHVLVFSDGGSRGNPGPAGCGAVITDKDGKVLKKLKKYLGVTTNNQAEYQALILGLQAADKMKAEQITCYLDSLLVVEQLNGKWKVKKAELKPHYELIKGFVLQHPNTRFHHIPREKNTMADQLANEAMDLKQ